MRIFVSYRRTDAARHVRTLRAALHGTTVAGEPCVVADDVDSIAPGSEFFGDVPGAVARSDVLLAVVGPNWLVTDEPNDHVRLETRTAAERGIPIVVVLVDGGHVPPAERLPPDMLAVTAAPRVRVDVPPGTGRVVAELETLTALHPATVRMLSARAGWFTEGRRREVRADGTPIGTVVDGAPLSTEFTLAAGTWSITVGRDRRWSEPLTLTLEPGQLVDLRYGVTALGRSSLRRTSLRRT